MARSNESILRCVALKRPKPRVILQKPSILPGILLSLFSCMARIRGNTQQMIIVLYFNILTEDILLKCPDLNTFYI